MDCFPKEIQLHIFSYLNQAELLSASLSQKLWMEYLGPIFVPISVRCRSPLWPTYPRDLKELISYSELVETKNLPKYLNTNSFITNVTKPPLPKIICPQNIVVKNSYLNYNRDFLSSFIRHRTYDEYRMCEKENVFYESLWDDEAVEKNPIYAKATDPKLFWYFYEHSIFYITDFVRIKDGGIAKDFFSKYRGTIKPQFRVNHLWESTLSEDVWDELLSILDITLPRRFNIRMALEKKRSLKRIIWLCSRGGYIRGEIPFNLPQDIAEWLFHRRLIPLLQYTKMCVRYGKKYYKDLIKLVYKNAIIFEPCPEEQRKREKTPHRYLSIKQRLNKDCVEKEGLIDLEESHLLFQHSLFGEAIMSGWSKEDLMWLYKKLNYKPANDCDNQGLCFSNLSPYEKVCHGCRPEVLLAYAPLGNDYISGKMMSKCVPILRINIQGCILHNFFLENKKIRYHYPSTKFKESYDPEVFDYLYSLNPFVSKHLLVQWFRKASMSFFTFLIKEIKIPIDDVFISTYFEIRNRDLFNLVKYFPSQRVNNRTWNNVIIWMKQLPKRRLIEALDVEFFRNLHLGYYGETRPIVYINFVCKNTLTKCLLIFDGSIESVYYYKYYNLLFGTSIYLYLANIKKDIVECLHKACSIGLITENPEKCHKLLKEKNPQCALLPYLRSFVQNHPGEKLGMYKNEYIRS